MFIINLIKPFLTKNLLLFKIIGILALFGFLIGGYLYWHNKIYTEGYNKANSEWDVYNKSIKLKQYGDLLIENNQVFKKQLKISELQDKISNSYKELQNEKIKYDNLVNSYASNAKRLRINGSTCNSATSTSEQSSNSKFTSEYNSGGQCLLMSETTVSIIDVARGTVSSVQKLNECIEQYNAIKNTINETSN